MHKISTDTLFIGRKLIYVPICHSTNDIALDLLHQKTPEEGTTVITDHQTAGRGQRGNSWYSEPSKNLMFSLILYPKFLPLQQQYFLNIFISLAICDTLSQWIGSGLKIKWPNDIYFLDRKIGGILTENSIKNNALEYSIIGIGLNINQTNGLPEGASSLGNITGSELNLSELFNNLVVHIEKRYLELRAQKFDHLRAQYLNNLYWYQEEHVFSNGNYFKGIILGVDSGGRLMIETQGTVKSFDIKEIKFIN
ncbi:biotin--[acetyl-CoA-carboxylase] ligase [Fulvivirgaceae bacterium BMA10]|uniref:Biotin--[acetyl-CoA-carboxylase] ligase n=1 Tax=Splendidivirga corallicola TaxID=3051826 RepID=A0ABT8KWM3_9BACT|nr:biotin--[acetyl-CoA-carboxylase] ligase [Fulvivirgaceae bacterium BMA10]